MAVELELSLPNQEGFMTLVKLVPIASRPQVPVVVLTLMTQRGVWEIAKQSGAYTCLAKQHSTGEDLHRAAEHWREPAGDEGRVGIRDVVGHDDQRAELGDVAVDLDRDLCPKAQQRA